MSITDAEAAALVLLVLYGELGKTAGLIPAEVVAELRRKGLLEGAEPTPVGREAGTGFLALMARHARLHLGCPTCGADHPCPLFRRRTEPTAPDAGAPPSSSGGDE